MERKFNPVELVRLTGMTQERLAKELGVSKATIARRVAGNERKWTVLEIEKLSQLTRVPLENVEV